LNVDSFFFGNVLDEFDGVLAFGKAGADYLDHVNVISPIAVTEVTRPILEPLAV
jgi:hypothetical protein